MASKELRRIRPLIQKIQALVETNEFVLRTIPAASFSVIKSTLKHHEIEEWALLIKGLLLEVFKDLRDQGLLTPVFETAFKDLINVPGLGFYFWKDITHRARDEIFVDTLCEIVPRHSPRLVVKVRLGIHHLDEVYGKLELVKKRIFPPNAVLPEPWHYNTRILCQRKG